MGSGIAEICARRGLDVIVVEASEQDVTRGRQRVEASLERAVRAGRADERDRASSGLRWSTDVSDLADRGLVIEAIVEDEAPKVELFAKLDATIEDRDAILASNTSSIPIMKLAMATQRQDHVIGLHLFNPVPAMNLVELVPSLLSSLETQGRAEAFARDLLGKQVIRSKEVPGSS